jgi:hypothetical protein
MTRPIDLSELTVDSLGKTVIVQDREDANKGYLLGRLVAIRHWTGADGTPQTRVKVEIFEDVDVTVTLRPDKHEVHLP